MPRTKLSFHQISQHVRRERERGTNTFLPESEPEHEHDTHLTPQQRSQRLRRQREKEAPTLPEECEHSEQESNLPAAQISQHRRRQREREARADTGQSSRAPANLSPGQNSHRTEQEERRRMRVCDPNLTLSHAHLAEQRHTVDPKYVSVFLIHPYIRKNGDTSVDELVWARWANKESVRHS